MGGWKKIFHVNGNDRKVGVIIFISDKVDIKNKGHKERQRRILMIKKSVQDTHPTVYTPNIEAPKYIQQILTDIKGEMDGNTIILEDF